MNSSFEKNIHYVWLGNEPHEMMFVEYLSIVSSIMYCQPKSINIWSEVDFYGKYYEALKDVLTIHKIKKDLEIYGNKIIHTPIHGWSDIYRNLIIYEYGGIYCDFDILWCKDISPLLESIDSFAIAEQGIHGREGCNMGVMIGEKNHKFCEMYLQLYQKYDEYEQKNHIGLFSTQYPQQIALSIKDEMTILPYTTFHWPLYHTNSIRWFYFNRPDDKNTLVDNLSGQLSSDTLLDNYAHHCFGIKHPGINEYITEEFILNEDTSFTRKAKAVLNYGKNNFLHSK
jgi:hypothetical protein